MPRAAKEPKEKGQVEIKIYATSADKDDFKRAADADGRSLSNWMVELGKRAVRDAGMRSATGVFDKKKGR